MDSQQTFISHMLELRDRLLRSAIAWIVLFVCLFPWANDLYALLAQPMLNSLPKGGQMMLRMWSRRSLCQSRWR